MSLTGKVAQKLTEVKFESWRINNSLEVSIHK